MLQPDRIVHICQQWKQLNVFELLPLKYDWGGSFSIINRNESFMPNDYCY